MNSNYKVLHLLLNQTGTDAPTFHVLENTFGDLPIVIYENPGEYYLQFQEEVLTENKTSILTGCCGTQAGKFDAWRNGLKEVNMATWSLSTDSNTNGHFVNTTLIIKVKK